MSGDPCSPSSHLSSSTPSSHCSSRPSSPMPSAQRPSGSIDFGRIADLETDLLPEDCLDGSEFDQYLPPGAHSNQQLYHGQYLKHSCAEGETNNNIHKNMRHFNAETILPDSEGYSCEDIPPMMRYHELQPSNALVKNERFPSTAHSYPYQNTMGINGSGSGYYSSTGQYLPSYQYMPPQRSVFTNPGSYVVNTVAGATPNDNWTNYV